MIDTATGLNSTLGFTLTDTSNTISLSLTSAVGSAGTYNHRIDAMALGTTLNSAYTFTVVVLTECDNPGITITEPSVPTTSFYCYENTACTISVGSYTTTSTCAFTYEVYDASTSAVSTLPFTVTSTSNTLSLDITPATSTAGTYNLKMYVTLSGNLKN